VASLLIAAGLPVPADTHDLAYLAEHLEQIRYRNGCRKISEMKVVTHNPSVEK
jgi:hypothetical protein